ncbi:MAG: glycosyltransferase family 2 protein [Rudaea sp.]|uniref:glycosyltransferase family 2 protein n=1 Tax=Rudaea sp. TaxID=2136325 RepID=UPI0039E419D0
MSAWVFWLGIGVVGYAYLGYPLLARLLARRFGSAPRCTADTPPLTVVIAAYNEAARITARIRNILEQDYPGDKVAVLVVSDGSSDDTPRAAAIADNVRVVALDTNQGKAAAINVAMEHVATPLVVFTDVRQRFAPDALRRLVAPFADASVGAVSGELEIVADLADRARTVDIGLYWRMEKALREDEAKLAWLHGVSGAIHALRKECFRPLPPGTLLDDMWMPLQVVIGGRRVWMARDAIAYDSASAQGREEFRRKLRTLAGNWQLLAHLPRLLDPWRNPVFLAWLSHKFLRLIVPWALLAALAASACAQGAVYRVLLVAQSLAYLAATVALLLPRAAAKVPLLSSAGTFLALNLAALFSLPAWLAFDPRRLWKKH